jgi:hypothetical protein
MIPGFAIVYLAKLIVKKYKLNERSVCNFENELTDEEILEYKLNKAILKVKIFGLIVALPGLILFLIIFYKR